MNQRAVLAAAPVPLVLVASPMPAVRRRWGRALRERFPVHEADRRSILEQRVDGLRPDVIFLDVALPGLGGVGGVPAIQRLSPPARIVLLTGAPGEKQAVLALLAGARGYCDRSIGPPLMRKAVDVVQGGEIWIERRVVPHLLQKMRALGRRERHGESSGSTDTPLRLLGSRELEVARLVGGGASNKDIATRLGISEATVKAHLTSIFRKLNVSDRLRLALFVAEHRGGRGVVNGLGRARSN